MDLGESPPRSADADRRRARLTSFVEPHLHPAEQIRAILSRTGEPQWLLDTLGQLASLYGLADAVATHRAIVVTDMRVYVIRMPWLRSWSIERESDVTAVAVSGFDPGTQPAGGLLVKPGTLALRFAGGRDVAFVFGVDGVDLPLLRHEAEAVASAIEAPTATEDRPSLDPDGR